MDIFENLKRYTWWALSWYTVASIIIGLINLSSLGRDDSDPDRYGDRSGLRVRTDSLTGCQYLESSKGNLIPRLDRTMQHIGCR